MPRAVATLLQADDQLFMVLENRIPAEFVDCVFSSTIDRDITELSAKELRVKGNTSVASIAYSYDIHIAAEPNDTL